MCYYHSFQQQEHKVAKSSCSWKKASLYLDKRDLEHKPQSVGSRIVKACSSNCFKKDTWLQFQDVSPGMENRRGMGPEHVWLLSFCPPTDPGAENSAWICPLNFFFLLRSLNGSALAAR